MSTVLIKNQIQKEQKITLQTLLEELSNQIYQEGIELHKVTQSFLGKPKRTFLVRYLEGEVDNASGMVFFDDTDSILSENLYALKGFLISSVKRVSKLKSDDTDMDSYKIQFETGYVLIESFIS